MTLAEPGALGEFVGAIAVVVALLYLASLGVTGSRRSFEEEWRRILAEGESDPPADGR